jgi:hypothetical protein
MTIAGFGLSAFLFSSLSHSLFPGDVSSFLLLLAVGTSLPTLVGSFFLRPVRPGPNPDDATVTESGWNRVAGYEQLPDDIDEETLSDEAEVKDGETGIPVVQVRTPSPSPAMERSLLGESRSSSVDLTRTASAESSRSRSVPRQASSHELSPTRSQEHHVNFHSDTEDGLTRRLSSADVDAELGVTARSLSVPASVRTLGVHEVDIHGRELLKNGDFALITSVLVLRE